MKTLLAVFVLLGFGVAGALVWNHLRNRPEIEILICRPSNAPYADATCSGFHLALEESRGRVGRIRVKSRLNIIGPDGPCFFLVGDVGVAPFSPESTYCPILAGPKKLTEAVFNWAEREGLHVTDVLRELGDDRSMNMASIVRDAWKQGSSTNEPSLVLHAGESAPFSDASERFKKLKASGFKGRFLVFDAHPEVSCVDAPGQPEDGMLLVTPIFPPPADFIPRYRAFAGKDPGPHVYGGYLAGKAALELIANARSTSPEDLLAAASKIRPHPPALYVARGGRFHVVELLSFPTR